ncbi:glutathione S-transferase family protein [Aliiroseovarius sp. KMU-50]|uniref:Glutathione S-transferase family protein n=1 Tax=Aliiroseovarius salicola TaxID=3009082 RepID=A0ABT4W276_9RHOB|nr:glutathione S-transferase family protein [Aliiroseovarius sp. KMU-50]MDA5094075.1 glutathione S-transferase family protein [Aliiroseovarius sp. KMU-50]
MSDYPFRLHHVQYGRSIRVLWLIEEIGLEEKLGTPLEVVDYQIGSKEMFEGGLNKVSPATRIPALELGDITMSESGAIVQYLIEEYAPNLGVAPGQPGRTDFLQWIHYAETMASLIEQLNLQMVFLRPPAKPSPIVIKLNVARLRHTLAGLEARLAGRDWLLDQGFSGADIMLGFNLFAAPYYVKLDAFPNILAYKARIEAMPSYQRVVAREGEQRFYAQDFYPVPET